MEYREKMMDNELVSVGNAVNGNSSNMAISSNSTALLQHHHQQSKHHHNNKLYITPRTWHPHIYEQPPKHPTPHFIADILGFSRTDSCATTPRNNTTTSTAHYDYGRNETRVSTSNQSGGGGNSSNPSSAMMLLPQSTSMSTGHNSNNNNRVPPLVCPQKEESLGSESVVSVGEECGRQGSDDPLLSISRTSEGSTAGSGNISGEESEKSSVTGNNNTFFII